MIELLIVLAVIAILAGILLPVVASAKRKAAQASCTSNLRQAGIALALYTETWNGEYPQTIVAGQRWPAIAPILAGDRSAVLRCPLDVPEGRSHLPLVDRSVPISYKSTWLLWGNDSGYEAWKKLLELDPNPILLRCYLHDDRMRGMMLSDRAERGDLKNARSLLLRKDGSVVLGGRRDHADLIVDENDHARQDFKRDYWVNASDVSCPAEVCDGKMPDDLPKR